MARDTGESLPRGRLWTVDEVAWYLGVTPETLRQQRREGRAPGVLGFLVGERGPIRFRAADVDAWLDVQRGTSRTAAAAESDDIPDTLTDEEKATLIKGLVDESDDARTGVPSPTDIGETSETAG